MHLCMYARRFEIGPFAQREEPLGRARICCCPSIESPHSQGFDPSRRIYHFESFSEEKTKQRALLLQMMRFRAGKWGAGLTLEHNGEKALVRAANIKSLKAAEAET